MAGAGSLEEGEGGEIVAEFQEVCKQWRRMCAHGSEDYACADCKMYSSIDESVCRGIPDEDEAKVIESFVMSWAAEHPEPVYPTWGEWLQEIGVAEVGSGMLSIHPAIAEQPIPADIAQKLGIESKEN